MPNAQIIGINRKQNERKEYVFKPLQIKRNPDQEGIVKFPCIGLYDRKTGVLVSCPGFERWYIELKRDRLKQSETFRKNAVNICTFLNYLLWETTIDTFEEITLNILRDFLVEFKIKQDGTERDPKEWDKGIWQVYNFLINYMKSYKDHNFQINEKDLISSEVVCNHRTRRDEVFYEYNKLGVRPPRKHMKKNRFLLEPYLKIILEDAEKYDPMIAFGIALQSYAGLREGEVVNLTRSSISQEYGGFGMISKIKIDLTHEAAFAENYDKLSEFGSIKIYRMQEVYPDFLSDIREMYSKHESLLEECGIEKSLDSPLFVNKWGNPMSVHTYKGRVKKLFYDHFLPDIKKLCDSDATWAVHAPYIESYEKAYPGAHMFRHWFTMYLIEHIVATKNQDSIDIIATWRGDHSRESMEEYIHINQDMIATYRSVTHSFQKMLMEKI